MGSDVAWARDQNDLADEKDVLITKLEEAAEVADGLRRIVSGEDVAVLRTELVTASEAKERMDNVVSKLRGDLVQLQAIRNDYVREKYVSIRKRDEVNFRCGVELEAKAAEILEKNQYKEKFRRLTAKVY